MKSLLPTFSQKPGQGLIIPIGGAEDKLGEMHIHRRFIALSGGSDSKIVVIPSASDVAIGSEYKEIFLRLGAEHVNVLPIFQRKACNNPEFLLALDRASGIFITGGEPARLSEILTGTPIARKILNLNRSGVTVAGTSAGAIFISKNMIEHGENNCGPFSASIALSPGLGLITVAVIDQHFSERNRLGRLLGAVSRAQSAFGIGLDENTAVVIGPGRPIEVLGSGSVTIVDATSLSNTSLSRISENDSLDPQAVKIKVLREGNH